MEKHFPAATLASTSCSRVTLPGRPVSGLVPLAISTWTLARVLRSRCTVTMPNTRPWLVTMMSS